MSLVARKRENLLFFNPEIVFDGTTGGIKLLMTIDAFNGHINWVVQEGVILRILMKRENWHLVDYKQYLTLLNRNNVH